MTVSGPKVQDFTDRGRSLSVVVETDPVYEALLSLFVVHGGIELDEYEDGSTLIEQIDANAELRAALDDIGGCGELWLSLIGVAHDLPAPRTTAALADHLESMDPVDLRTTLLHGGIKHRTISIDEAIAAAAAGDTTRLDDLFDEHSDTALRRLIEGSPADTGPTLASVLRRLDGVVGSWLRRVQPVIEHDAASTRSMARTMSPARLVEKATNGITFEMQPSVSGVLLIPSVIVRPWVVVSEHGSIRIFCYSVPDEVLEGDLDAPPVYMVEVFKALGDERRLRILGVLAQGDIGLRDLADRVDLAKSTAHHHLRVLRNAGLVRITVGDDDKRYGLRRDSVPEVSRLLEGFLTGHEGTEPRKDTP